MECFVCYREYRLSPTGDVVYPKVGTCGHSICNECCDKLHLHSSNPKCPYCNRENSFEWQTRNFLAEDSLTLMENTDLVQSLLPQLKNLVSDLTDRKRELEKELNEAPKGFVAWLKWRMAGAVRDNKELVRLQGKVDDLIDLTTAVMRPKLSVPTVAPQQNALLQLEARSLETLEPGELIFGPAIEAVGCVWKIFVLKNIKDGEEFFGIGVQMTSKDNGKKYEGSGMFKFISQKRNVQDYDARFFGKQFAAPLTQMAKTNLKRWKEIVNSTYYRNYRLVIQCKDWTVNELE